MAPKRIVASSAVAQPGVTLSARQVRELQDVVWNYYAKNKRDMPWRTEVNEYFTLVSEVMLQQTQVSRVGPKFEQFIARFPTLQALASAPLADVLVAWSGLGYNRRAKYLWQAACMIQKELGGVFPDTQQKLQRLPGVGVNTAGAIIAYSYNKPAVFVETNIRTVILQHCFKNQKNVSDTEIAEVAKLLVPTDHIRQWYWALMDYGAYLKKLRPGSTRRAKSYTKQSKFEGSLRQMRGKVIRHLSGGAQTKAALDGLLAADDRYPLALDALQREGLIIARNGVYRLTDVEPSSHNDV